MKFAIILCITLILFVGCGNHNLDDPKVREKILAEAINEDNLQARQTSSGEELHYAPNQEQPYTGWIKRNHSLQQFRRGEPNGIYISWYGNGQNMEKGAFKKGKLHGLGVEWYENGQKRSEVTYKNGNLDGTWTEWYENEQKKSEGTYKNGKKNGMWTEWDQDGKKLQSENYKDGKGEHEETPTRLKMETSEENENRVKESK